MAVRRRLTEPPPKSPGTVAGESAAGEETATMVRRHFGLQRAKCVLIGSNSTTGHLGAYGRTARLDAISNGLALPAPGNGASGGVKPHKFGGKNWRRNLAGMSAGVSDNNQRPVFASKRAFATRRASSGRAIADLGLWKDSGGYIPVSCRSVPCEKTNNLRVFRVAAPLVDDYNVTLVTQVTVALSKVPPPNEKPARHKLISSGYRSRSDRAASGVRWRCIPGAIDPRA